MCHSSQAPPAFPEANEKTTSSASTQWKSRSGASQTRMRMPGLLVAIIVVAGLARRARVVHGFLQRLQVAGRLRQRLHGSDHLVHLGIEVAALLPDLGLRLGFALVGAFAEEFARIVGD